MPFFLCWVWFYSLCVEPCLNWTLPSMRGGVCHKPCFLSTVRAPQRGWSHLLACKVNRLGGVRHDDMSLSLVFKSVLNSVTFRNCCRFWKCAKEKILYRSNSLRRKEANSSGPHHRMCLGKTGILLLQTAKRFPWRWVKITPLSSSSFLLSVIDRLV